jgi:hypothetical protein
LKQIYFILLTSKHIACTNATGYLKFKFNSIKSEVLS